MPPKLTLRDAQEAARARGGECLSEVYVNTTTKMEWRCAEGHEWVSQFGNVRHNGSWCPRCGGRAKLTIKDAQESASLRGGACLSKVYVNATSKMEWRCAEGHEWSSSLNNVRNQNSWCPTCAGNATLTIAEVQDWAAQRGGSCLSVNYVNNHTKMEWRCAEGHEWSAIFGNIRYNGSWCPQCSGVARLTIDEAREAARHRGGKCLSTEYLHVRSPLDWECGNKHRWSACLMSVRNIGSWCPHCPLKNETECWLLFEELTGQKFAKSKPKWLDGLELDGYNEALRLAFEYQGEQHYLYIPHFHRGGEEDLHAQQERDRRKAELCHEEWVTLIEIPYWVKDKRAHIRAALEELGYFIASESHNEK